MCLALQSSLTRASSAIASSTVRMRTLYAANVQPQTLFARRFFNIRG